MEDKDAYLMSFTFPNSADPQKPPGGASFRFLLPEKNELNCKVSGRTIGVLGHYDSYTLEQHRQFQNIILAADDRAQALIAKEIGVPK
jgi:hypothetical protein